MKRRRHNEEEIIKKLREVEEQLLQGKSIEEASREQGVSVQTMYRWKQRYAGAKKGVIKRLRALEKENNALKKAVAELTLEKAILKEVAEGKW